MSPRTEDRVLQTMRAAYLIEEAQRRLSTRSVLQTAEARLLWYLREHGPSSRRDLEKGLGLGQSTVNRQVGTCISKGLVEPVTETGTRTQIIDSTALGRDLIGRHTAHYSDAYAEVLDFLPDDRQEQFLDLLGTFSERLAAAAAAPSPGPEGRDARGRWE